MWLLTGPLTISSATFILGFHWDWEKHSVKEQDVQLFLSNHSVFAHHNVTIVDTLNNTLNLQRPGIAFSFQTGRIRLRDVNWWFFAYFLSANITVHANLWAHRNLWSPLTHPCCYRSEILSATTPAMSRRITTGLSHIAWTRMKSSKPNNKHAWKDTALERSCNYGLG